LRTIAFSIRRDRPSVHHDLVEFTLPETAGGGKWVASGSWWKLPMATISSGDVIGSHATRSRICSAGATFRVFQPSTFRSVICPLANNAQNSNNRIELVYKMIN
jgi:hypothetical protein